MSDANTTTESVLFELLPGLPGVGPHPEQFTVTGSGTHSEGVVVRFHPRTSQAWVGNFQPGIYGYHGALLHPDGRTVIVVSGGQAYHIEPDSQRLLRHFGGDIADVVQDRARGLLVFSDGIRLWAMDVGGERWQTERISWDGIRDISIDGEIVVGEAYDPMCDRWSGFSVSLETGSVRGGTYRS